MIVLTVDQQGSRTRGDQVEPLLRDLTTGPAARATRHGVVRPFERTVGDEVQAVLDDAAAAVDLALYLVRRGGWTVGIGAGPVDEPLPATARAGVGEAFVLARDAVERGKSRLRPVPLAVSGADAERATECEALLTVVGAIMARRTPAGWAVIDAMDELGPEVTQEDLAHRLGISQQAVSQRLRTALWAEEVAVRPLAARLLAEADGASQDRTEGET